MGDDGFNNKEQTGASFLSLTDIATVERCLSLSTCMPFSKSD